MAVWVSRVYLRWYKSFNTATSQVTDAGDRPWDQFDSEEFRFVEVPLSSRVATIVGANETGKSHLLGAIEKVLKGSATSSQGTLLRYSPHDICRYCGLLTVADELWPQLGLEFTFDDRTERDACASSLGLAVAGLPESSFRVFIHGKSKEEYAQFYSASGSKIGSANKEDWGKLSKELPTCHFVRSDLSFENFIHIDQLIAQYEKKEASFFEPLDLQELASSLFSFNVSGAVIEHLAQQQTPGAACPTVEELE